MPDGGRSTGVQQGREWTLRCLPNFDLRVDEGPRLRERESVRVVEAVSPEPRPTDEELLGRLRRLLADDERRLGPVPESVMREVAEAWPDELAEPREGYDKHVEAESGGDKSDITRVLRLTASRLRDPEYHWYEHAAVTLERLAERLEKEG